MNPDLPYNSREELEAGLTALLLEELPPAQAAELRRAIEQDPALAALHQRLKLTIHLVRQTAVHPAEDAAAPSVLLRLSERRRQELLAHFKTVTPREFVRPRRQEWRLPVLVAAAAVLVGLLALQVFLPVLSASKRRSMVMAAAAAKPVALGIRSSGPQDGETLLERRLSGSELPPGPAPTPAQAVGGRILLSDARTARAPQLSGRLAQSEVWSPDGRLKYSENGQSVARDAASVALGPGLAPPAPTPGPRPSPGREAGGESGRESPPPAAANRTAIVLPGSTEAKETAGLTEAPGTHPGAPPSGGSSLDQIVRVFDLANADPQAAQQIPQDVFMRSGSIRANSSNNRNSMLGAGNPLTQRETKNQPNSSAPAVVAANPVVGFQSKTTNLPDASSPSSGPGNNLAWGVSGGGVQGGGGGGMGGMGGGMGGGGGMAPVPHVNIAPGGGGVGGIRGTPPAQAQSMAAGVWRGGSMYGIQSNLPEPNQVPESVAASGSTQSIQFGLVGLTDLGPVSKALIRETVRDNAPAEVATATTPLQEQMPILGDKPVRGKGFSDELAKSAAKDARSSTRTNIIVAFNEGFVKSAAEEAELKKRDLSSDLGLLDSSAKGLPAQNQPVGDATTAVADVYFSIEPESRRVFTNAMAGLFFETSSNNAEGKLGELRESEKLARGGVEALPEARGGVEPQKELFRGRYAYAGAMPEAPGLVGQQIANASGRASLSGLASATGTNVNARGRPVPSFAYAEPIDRLGAVPSPSAGAELRVEPDQPVRKQPAAPAPIPQPEVQTRENAFSTFSLNVSDVSFNLAAASLEQGMMPEPATVRSEEFINAFDYRDPEAPAGVPVAFACERARYPFAQNRDLVRFSLKTAAQGRQAGRPLNVVLLLDNSGSMERADRVRIIHEALRVLAAQFQPQDTLSVVTFARTAQLRVDGAPGSQAAQVAEELSGLTPQGGTNLEEAMNLAYQTALRHYLANGINRVVLLTDGAANLGSVEPEALKRKVEARRKQGIALDCFGIGWEGYNDDLLEVLSRNGDGRYGFLNTPEEAATEFAGQLAGALRVAASEVKVQVEFNPARVRAYRQVGYARHQLAKEQFRDNTVAAAQMGAAESGNALYVIETDPRGEGPLGVVRVRYRVPGTSDYREQEWTAPYTGSAAPLERASAALRLAAVAGAFSEWLASSPFAGEVTTERLLGYLRGVPDVYGPDARPRKLEWMLRQAQSLGGK